MPSMPYLFRLSFTHVWQFVPISLSYFSEALRASTLPASRLSPGRLQDTRDEPSRDSCHAGIGPNLSANAPVSDLPILSPQAVGT